MEGIVHCVHVNQMTSGILSSMIHTVEQGVLMYAQKVIDISNKDAIRTFHSLFLMRTQDLELYIDPKTAVSDARTSAPPLCFVASLTGSAGSFFNFKRCLVLLGMHATGTPIQTLLLSTLLPVRQSERDGAETARIIIPIHTPHCIDTKPCTDSGSTSPRIACFGFVEQNEELAS